jgi:D-threo-aldose 1-dehydrogenase
MKKKPLGKTGLLVTPLCVGTSALGNFPAQYGYEVSTERAVATLHRVFESPVNFIDTSNEYGKGESERRIGRVLAERGGLPEGFVLATKVDPLPGSSDFSGERVRASVGESLERLGLERLQLVFLHDPEKITFEEATAAGGAVEALVRLRDEGSIEHLGVAGGPIDLMLRYLRIGIFEVVISHNRYTLIDQSAEPLLKEAAEAGIGFINAAPYGGGILVKGPDVVPKYCYQPASESTLQRVKQMKTICQEHSVPLPAAALQFSMREERIASTIVGITEPERIEQTFELADWAIPKALWEELEPAINEGKTNVGSHK